MSPVEAPVIRRLALMRHASAEPTAATDHARPLAATGAAEARAAAAWARSVGFTPDHVLLSDARRTQETARYALEAWPDESPLWDATPALYEAGPESMLDLIRRVPADTHGVLVVGHNPTVAQLAQLLDDGTGHLVDPMAGYPPASITVFDVPMAWLELTLAGAPVLASRAGDDPWTR